MSDPKGFNKEDPDTSKAAKSIQNIFDAVARIDERVKIINERQKEIDATIKNFASELHSLKEKVAIIVHQIPQEEITQIRDKVHALDVQSENLKLRVGNHDNQWGKIFDAFWKITLMIIATYILYKLGIN